MNIQEQNQINNGFIDFNQKLFNNQSQNYNSQGQQQQPKQNPELGNIQYGKILKKQNELMEKIIRNEMIRQNEKMSRKITLTFKLIGSKNDNDLLPIEFKATTKLKDVLEKYKNDSNNRNIKFMIGGQELVSNDERLLGEIEEINDGGEIRVEPNS